MLYSKPSSVPNPPLAVVNTTLPVVINDDVMSVIRDLLLVILEVILDDTDVNDPDIIVDVNTGFDSNIVVLEPKLELVALNAPLISEDICAELDNVPTETVGLFSNDATLVLNDADGAINEPDIPVAVKLLINTAFVPNEPDIPPEVNPTAPPSSKNVILVEIEELGATNDPDIIVDVNTGFDSNTVVLVLNEADGAINDSEILVAVKLLINVALGPREPEILVELNTGFDSNAVVLVLNDELGATNEPDIIADVNTALLSNTVVLVLNDPLSVFKFDILVENEADGATNDPEMLVAICAEPDNVPGVTVGLFSSTATLVLKLALGALNDPEIIVELNTGLDSNAVVLVLNDADEALNDPDIIVELNTGFASNEVTLVEIDELGAVNDPEIFVAVKLLINTAFAPNEPDIIVDVNTSFPSNEATLVLNDPLSVFKLVILELKLELVFVNEPDILAAVKLLINVALGPRDPDIPEDVNPTAPPPSRNVILLEIEELGDVNDPLIFEAICAEPDKVPGAVIFNNVDPSPTNDPLNTEPVTA